MKDLRDKTAVVTGAASGIGRGVAEHLASEGMRTVLSDIEREPLEAIAAELRARGARVTAVPADVSRDADVAALANEARDAFGNVHVLCNCAGVAVTGAVWEHPLADWEWLMGVNVWGLIHALRSFVPMMLEHGEACHTVNTASVSGLTANQGSIYTMTKAAVVSITESLYLQLQARDANIGVSLLCPGPVSTRIVDSDRNRPTHLQSDYTDAARNPDYDKIKRDARPKLEAGATPASIAEAVAGAIRDERFYVLTHPEFNDDIRRRMEDILQGENPSWRVPGAGNDEEPRR